MSEYTPNEEQVREQYTQEQPPQIGSMAEERAEFDRFIARIKAEAWDEGYWQGGNDVGSGLRENELTPNPYLGGHDDE